MDLLLLTVLMMALICGWTLLRRGIALRQRIMAEAKADIIEVVLKSQALFLNSDVVVGTELHDNLFEFINNSVYVDKFISTTELIKMLFLKKRKVEFRDCKSRFSNELETSDKKIKEIYISFMSALCRYVLARHFCVTIVCAVSLMTICLYKWVKTNAHAPRLELQFAIFVLIGALLSAPTNVQSEHHAYRHCNGVG